MTTAPIPDDVSAIVGAFEAQLGDRTCAFALLARFRVTDGAQARVEQAFDKAVQFLPANQREMLKTLSRLRHVETHQPEWITAALVRR